MSSPHFRARRVVFCASAIAAVAFAIGDKEVTGAREPTEALVNVLRQRGMSVAPDDVAWLDAAPSGLQNAWRAARAVVRAAPSAGEPSDIFLVNARLSPNRVLLDVGDAYNVSETSGADESRPVLHGDQLAYVARSLVGQQGTFTVHLVDLGGESSAASGGWTRLQRAQNALTNWQRYGQLRGIDAQTYALVEEPTGPDAPQDSGASPITVRWGADSFVVGAGERQAPIGGSSEPPAWLRRESGGLARPGGVVQWSVDRVRTVIGDDAMQTIKAVAFTALDFVMRHKEQLTGDTGEADIAADLGQSQLDPPSRSIPGDPEIGWPPPPLEAWVTPALPGEGNWNPQDRDPFVGVNPGLPPAFLTTFIRSDRGRKATRVYVALWDPRQVELHMMAGTVEPKGATGEAGPGLIPRTPEVMRRVVAASNAGFQALHGEFGMMADGVVYLPPKPYAATVTELRDGSTAFGSWPAETTIPEAVLSYRQNMTVMVLDEKFNPYKRTWWGGTPPGWADKTHTVRTGICLTKEHFVAYFYGADISPDALAQAMIQTRCIFGMALDMNAGHSGLEFYRAAPASELEPLGRPLSTDWEAEGNVPGLEGWRFRGRRLIRGMGLMEFPRYIKREARDFFYMTLRSVLPGHPISPVIQPPEPSEGEWRLKGLPHHGFPYAVATSEIRPDPARPTVRARVLQVDPRTVRAATTATSANLVLAVDVDSAIRPAGVGGERQSLYHSTGAFSLAEAPPVPGAVRIATGTTHVGVAAAVVGILDDGGMLVYAELAPTPPEPSAADGKVLDALLEHMGCSSRLLLAGRLKLALGGDTDVAGQAMHALTGPSVVQFVRAEAAGGRRIFEDTPIVPLDVWYPLQQKRIRYFKRPEPAAAPDP
jgi:hypothetical protein